MVSLPDLPPELLLKIVESDNCHHNQKVLYGTLRASCRAVSSMITPFLDSRFYGDVIVHFDPQDISRLLAISQGNLQQHVHTVEIRVDTLWTELCHCIWSDSSGASECSWQNMSDYCGEGSEASRFSFNEVVADFMADGSCASRLKLALRTLRNMTKLVIVPPVCTRWMVNSKRNEIFARWSLASKILLSSIPFAESYLADVSFVSQSNLLAIPLSSLDVVALSSAQADSLQKLGLNTIVDLKGGIVFP